MDLSALDCPDRFWHSQQGGHQVNREQEKTTTLPVTVSRGEKRCGAKRRDRYRQLFSDGDAKPPATGLAATGA